MRDEEGAVFTTEDTEITKSFASWAAPLGRDHDDRLSRSSWRLAGASGAVFVFDPRFPT